MGAEEYRAEGVERFLSGVIGRGELPGAVYRVEGPDGLMATGAVGRAAFEPEEAPAREETIYDLASLTKAACTSLLALLAHGEGTLPLERPLSQALADLRGSRWEGVTAADCLLHRGGLPAWAPLYCLAASRDEVPAAVARLAPHDGPPGGVLYSDLGPILVGLALERAWEEGLAGLFRARVAEPLGLRSTLFRPTGRLVPRIAPTERGNAREMEMAAEFPGDPCSDRSWPDRLLHGEPHDGNARFLGGAGGHAGLFGTAAEVAALGREVLRPSGRLLAPEDRERLLAPYEPPAGEVRCLLGQTGSDPDSPASCVGPQAAGHTGYTGTSLFLDPGGGTLFVLLANRVHPADERRVSMNGVRRGFHRAASAWIAESAGR